MPLFVSVIIAAGGRGQRFGGARPKQLVEVGGRAILDRTVAAFAGHRRVTEIVVALPAELAAAPPPYLGAGTDRIKVVAGGPRRQDSVARAFAAIDRGADLVLIHDAARPFVSAALIERTIDAAAESGAALAAVQARDTVKRTTDARYVDSTIARESVFLAQTPQAFRRDVLAAALALAEQEGIDATDEAALAERGGHRVRLVEGEATNIKVTTPDDLPVAEAIAQARSGEAIGPSAPGDRVGTGYDLHRLVEGRPLVVGGVTIAAPKGPLGHSDGDVVCHAAIDAMFGAAAAGDIGAHFPDSDPRWKDASSLDLLSRAAEIVLAAGFAITNLDVTVVLESPKIRPHVDRMRAAVAGALRIPDARVSIKAKSNEGVDALGRGEAIAAHAVALLRTR